MVVAVPDNGQALELQAASNVGVRKLFFDESSYPADVRSARPTGSITRGNRLAYLRDLFYSHQPAARFSFAPMTFPWLNPTQKGGQQWAKDVMVVHGPRAQEDYNTRGSHLQETLNRESQVLVCAQSNMAVDWISERLVDPGSQRAAYRQPDE